MKTKVQNTENEPLSLAAVSGSTDHDIWLQKFEKSKEGKLFNLRHEFDSLNTRFNAQGRPDINSYSANAMWIVARGTRFEEDMKYFIEILSPDFFKDDTVP